MNEPTPNIVWVGLVMCAGIVAFMVRAWFRMRPLSELQPDPADDDESIEMLPLVEIDEDDGDPD